MSLRTHGPEPCASTNSATRARVGAESYALPGGESTFGTGFLDFLKASLHTSRPARPPTMAAPNDKHRLIAQNRRARHEYLILDQLVCGIELKGTEVKSLREGKAEIAQAFGQIKDGELWLMGSSIPEYSHGTAHNHTPARTRRLLAHRSEIAKWYKKVRERGITIVPLDLHFDGNLVKVTLALAQGKKLHDKRQAEREKDSKRQIRRAMGR